MLFAPIIGQFLIWTHHVLKGLARYAGHIGLPLGDRPYFVVHRQQPLPGPSVGAPMISRTTGAWMINMSRALPTPEGRFAGVIVAALQPDWFARLWAEVGLGDAEARIKRDGALQTDLRLFEQAQQPLGVAQIA